MVKLDFNKKGIKLYNGNCFDVFKNIKDKTIDLFILDLPYGQTACEWDTCIDLKQMWIDIKRIMKPSAILCFFCTTKFGYQLIKSNEKWFKYDLIWQKSRKVGFLSANKRQLRNHENIYVFSNDDKNVEEINSHIIEYSKKVLKYIGKTKAEIKKNIKHADHFFRYSKGNFSLPTEETYKKLIKLYKIDKMEGYIKYDDLKKSFIASEIDTTYNPQKTEGKPYKTKGNDLTSSYYRDNKNEYKSKANNNKGDRHPTSIIDNETTILKYNNPHKTIHRTEKPIGLLEYLIKTYSNEGDLIMDFTMGSGSCGVACYNTKRKFIGVEMDKDIYQLTKNRIEEHLKK